MINKFLNSSKRVSVVLIAAVVLTTAAFGQLRSDSKVDSTAKSGTVSNVKEELSRIPMLTAQSTVGQVGENVRIFGSQFRSNESVTVAIEVMDPESSVRQSVDHFVNYADENGNLVIQWTIPAEGRFLIGAMGTESGKGTYRVVDGLTATRTLVPINAATYTCADVNANPVFTNVNSDWGFKVDETADTASPSGTYALVNSAGPPPTVLTGGAPSDPANSVTVNFNSGTTQMTWSATRPITTVIVKGGSGGVNVYSYDPYSFGDDGSVDGPLTTATGNQAISHVEFCFEPLSRIIVKKHATPPSSFQFQFSATGLLTSNFTLTDNSSTTDAMIEFETTPGMKTISEINPSPYTLRSIVCVSANGNSSSTVLLPTASVNLANGDTVTCTFNNDFTTATEASIAGRVTDQYGNSVKDAIVSATDSNGTTVTARTNQFGRYTMTVEGGLSLFMNASRKGYTFGSQLINVNEDTVTVDFTGMAR